MYMYMYMYNYVFKLAGTLTDWLTDLFIQFTNLTSSILFVDENAAKQSAPDAQRSPRLHRDCGRKLTATAEADSYRDCGHGQHHHQPPLPPLTAA